MPDLSPGATPAGDVRIETYRGSRDDLRPLSVPAVVLRPMMYYIGAGPWRGRTRVARQTGWSASS